MRLVLLVYASLLEACITGMRRVLLLYALLLEACHRNRHQTNAPLHELSVLNASASSEGSSLARVFAASIHELWV